jgi:RNA polymerase sigma factor (sigma-70 family)
LTEPPGIPAALGGVDVAIVRAAQRGRPGALDELIRQVTPYVARICGAIALEDGDDAMQEALIAVARYVPSLREPGAFKAWVRRIAIREAVRTARRRPQVQPLDDDDAAAVPDIETITDVRSTLARLHPEQRAVLVLKDLEGFSELEVAELLGIQHGTVKSRLHRARAAFVRKWDP